MNPELVEDLFKPVGGSGGRLRGQLPPGAKDGAGGTGIRANRSKIPGITQGGFILGTVGKSHAGGSAAKRQSLAPGAGPGRLRPGKRVERAQGGAGLEGGVDVMERAAGERPGRDGRRRDVTSGRGVKANHDFEVKCRCALCHQFRAKTHSPSSAQDE